MGRHTQAKCKLCRREKEKLFLKGEKCYTEKCPFNKRAYPPGQHGKMPSRVSEYGIRLREKQKARRVYGVTEKQFEKYFNAAARSKGATGEKLLEALERRLDNIVFRLGFVTSRQAARQMVRHGGIYVNGRKVDIPSCQLKPKDVVKVVEKRSEFLKANMGKLPDYLPPTWLTVTAEGEGTMASIPKRIDIDTKLEDHLIVEYYSR